MTTLLHTPLSPFGRLARLALAEDGRAAELTELAPTEEALTAALEARDVETPLLSAAPFALPFGAPMGPVLLTRGAAICGAEAICEYLVETREGEQGVPLLRGAPIDRAEARRLAAWAGESFWRDAVAPALSERFLKSVFGGEPPETPTLREAAEAARRHLDAAGGLIEARGWLAGERVSLADFALAAQISVLDYLGAWPFYPGDAPDPARDWYALIKSRPAFRGILADRSPRLPPSEAYQELDF